MVLPDMILIIITAVVVVSCFFGWALVRVGNLPNLDAPNLTGECWSCGKQIPPDFEFCTRECLDLWNTTILRIGNATGCVTVRQ